MSFSVWNTNPSIAKRTLFIENMSIETFWRNSRSNLTGLVTSSILKNIHHTLCIYILVQSRRLTKFSFFSLLCVAWIQPTQGDQSSKIWIENILNLAWSLRLINTMKQRNHNWNFAHTFKEIYSHNMWICMLYFHLWSCPCYTRVHMYSSSHSCNTYTSVYR